MTRAEVDCRGMRCPRPVIELAAAVGRADVGDEVAVVADDLAAGVDIEAWCRMRGQEYVGREESQDGVPTYVVRRVS